MKITAIFYDKKGKKVRRVLADNAQRISQISRLTRWAKAYLRVAYGKARDVWGKMVLFDNVGFYNNKKDFGVALRAFCEK